MLLICLMLVLLLVDYRQTLDIKNHSEDFETNIILGKHPSDLRITVYFISAAALFVVLFLVFPFYAQIAWFLGWAAVEVWAICNNNKLGLKIL